jgi:hypothetical protein
VVKQGENQESKEKVIETQILIHEGRTLDLRTSIGFCEKSRIWLIETENLLA